MHSIVLPLAINNAGMKIVIKTKIFHFSRKPVKVNLHVFRETLKQVVKFKYIVFASNGSYKIKLII